MLIFSRSWVLANEDGEANHNLDQLAQAQDQNSH